MFFYTFLPKLINMSLTAGVAVVFVLLARLLLRRMPKAISYALWGVVLFRLLCPVSLPSGLSLLGLLDAPASPQGALASRVEYISPDIVHTENPQVSLPIPGVGEAITQALPQGEEQLAADPLEAPMAIAACVILAAALLTNPPEKPQTPLLPNSLEGTAYEVQEWLDYRQSGEMPWGGRREINLDAFPGVTFRWMPEQVEAVLDSGEILPLYSGMPVWSVYFADLTGDGLPELCSALSMGSGIVDDRVILYDYANGASYSLEDRMANDYSLSLEEGRLVVTRRPFGSAQEAERGYLVYQDEAIQILPLKTSDAEAPNP